MTEFDVYCDGACEPNPGPGGWGFVVYRGAEELFAASGGDLDTTNNQMEMTGALRALEWIAGHAPGRARLLSDSQYVVKGCTLWRHRWKLKGWARGKAAPLANADLWRALDAVLTRCPAPVSWVKGHSGLRGNERADELSQIGRLSAGSGGIDELLRQQLAYSI